MGKHALLSASSSKRLSCTPSARLEEQFKDEPGGSVYAEEGTAAHSLAEHKLKKALKRRSKRPVSDYHCDEMEECTDGYVAFAMEQVELARQECKDPVVLIEQRLDYSAYVPEGFGTGYLLIVADKVLTVIDLKYGKGVAVEAERNPQMMLYGLGALELFDALYDIETIRMTIYQPRLESVSTWELSVKDLMKWRSEMNNNKVKFNICNCHYALQKTQENGEMGFENPVAMPGAVSIALDPNGEPESFYADGIEYYIIANNMGYDGDLELALIPESFRTDVLKEEADNNEVLVENAHSETAAFALLFEFDGDIRKIRHVLYNCSASRPKIEGKTNEESREVQTETLTIKARPLASGYVKAKTGNKTSAETYADWYKSVYLPEPKAVDAETEGQE